jgi:hypothetical protein
METLPATEVRCADAGRRFADERTGRQRPSRPDQAGIDLE